VSIKTLTRFLKYFIIGLVTFLFDLFLLYFCTDILLINYLTSTGLAFLIAISINYFLSRRFVFSKTKRKISHGYYIFVTTALLGLLIVILLMGILVEVFRIDYLFARVITAARVGIYNYSINLFIDFKVTGKH